MWWQALVGIIGGLLLIDGVLLSLLWRYARRHPETVTMRDALRLFPDLLRLTRRLAADTTLPRGIRIRLLLLLLYLASPIDVVPDFIPVIGYADDAVVLALVLRSVARPAAPDSLAPPASLLWCRAVRPPRCRSGSSQRCPTTRGRLQAGPLCTVSGAPSAPGRRTAWKPRSPRP